MPQVGKEDFRKRRFRLWYGLCGPTIFIVLPSVLLVIVVVEEDVAYSSVRDQCGERGAGCTPRRLLDAVVGHGGNDRCEGKSEGVLFEFGNGEGPLLGCPLRRGSSKFGSVAAQRLHKVLFL